MDIFLKFVNSPHPHLKARKFRKEVIFPCAVWNNCIDSNSILCQFCKYYVHKRCTGITGRLKQDYEFNPFEPSVAFYIKNSRLFCSVNQMASFYMKCNSGLKWVKCPTCASQLADTVEEFPVRIEH